MSAGASGAAAAVSSRYACNARGKACTSGASPSRGEFLRNVIPSSCFFEHLLSGNRFTPSGQSSRRCFAGDALGPIQAGIGARGSRVERALQRTTRAFQRRGPPIGRHTDRVADHRGTPSERQIDGGTLPCLELDAAPGCDCERIDGAAGCARELDDAEACHPGDLWNVRRERDIVAFRQCREHFPESAHATLADELVAQIPGTADRFDPQPFGNLRIELAVAVTRNQDFRPVLSRALYERGQEFWALPKSQKARTVAGSPFGNVRRLRHERGRLPAQP